MKHLFFTAALFFSLAFISCGSSSEVDDLEKPTSKEENTETSFLWGEWYRVYLNEYMYDGTLVKSYKDNYISSPKNYPSYVFLPNNKLYEHNSRYSPYNAEYKLNNGFLRLTVNYGNSYHFDDSYEIIKIDVDSLVLKQKYEDTEYDYEVYAYYHMKKYEGNPNLKLSDEEKYFLGNWETDVKGDSYHYWQIYDDGTFYVSEKSEDNAPNPYYNNGGGLWTYNATTMTFSTSSGFNYLILTANDQYFSCQDLKSSKKKVYTFTRKK